MNKKTLWYQSLAITVFVFGMLWFANKITDLKIFTAFDTIGQSMKDFELTDYAFSKLREKPSVDERIVLVNIGTLDRRGIARQIQIINSFHPRVIAYDGFFNCEGNLYDTLNCPQLLDTLGNLMLASAINETKKFVLGSKLLQTRELRKTDVEIYDSLELSDPMFMTKATTGFASLITDANYQEDVKLCRSIFPQWEVNGQRQLAFSTQIANQYDSLVTKKYLDRNVKEELINYRGNMTVMTLRYQNSLIDQTSESNFANMFYTVDWDELLRGDVLPTLFEDRIVMLGYLGDHLGDPAWEDKFFTPINKKVAGRANPDMFGLVVHANVVAMILNEDYINTIPDWAEWTAAFIVCLFTVFLFIYVDKVLPTWFDALSFVIQLAELLLISTLIVFAFKWWNMKLELGIALGVSALVGPSYDIFKSLQNEYNKRFPKQQKSEITKAGEPV